MKRTTIACLLALVGGAMMVGTASATLSELGFSTDTTPPSCPKNPCFAVSRTTGFQAKLGTTVHPLTVRRDGRIVAWSIALGAPNAKQITFFNTNEGGSSEAAIAILRPGPKLNYTLIAQSPLIQLQPYFGQTPQFPLTTTLAVKKGDTVALTVPTWAPALALNFPSDTSWRASRQRKACSNTTNQTAQTAIASTIQYFCLYKTARLTYSATFIANPIPHSGSTGSTGTTGTTGTTGGH